MAYSSEWEVKDFGDITLRAKGLELTGDDSTILTDTITFGNATNIPSLTVYEATVTVANGATAGKEAAIAMPAYFTPAWCGVHVTTAATNAVTLTDIGDDADTDSFVDGATSVAINSTGFKGWLGCNGVRGMGDITGGSQGGPATPDEVEVVISGDPGATGVTMRLTFVGIQGS